MIPISAFIYDSRINAREGDDKEIVNICYMIGWMTVKKKIMSTDELRSNY